MTRPWPVLCVLLVACVDRAGSVSADGGSVDGGAADGSRDDGGAFDGGLDADLPGVTCTVQYRNGDCGADPAMTYEDVPFAFMFSLDRGAQSDLTSPLMAFNDFYAAPPDHEVPFGAVDPAGTEYAILGVPGSSTRIGVILTVDVSTSRGGGDCDGLEPPDVPPLISIQCAGTTLLSPRCTTVVDGYLEKVPSPLACAVVRRNAACAEMPEVTEHPRFWLVPGAHGPESELHSDSAAFTETLGGADEVVLYQEAPCGSYTPDIRVSAPTLLRHRDEIIADVFEAESTTTCRDSLGRAQPVTRMSCFGRSTFVSPP